MKIPQNKYSVEKQEIKQDGKLCEPEGFVKGMARNLTTLDTIGLVALIMLLQGLSQCTRIEYDSLREKDEGNE